MNVAPFKLERYFAKYEFTTRYLFSCSDCDGFPMSYVLEQATAEELQWWEQLRLGYTESEGSSLLREAICPLYESIGPQQLVVSSPGEANFILMNSLLQPGDHLVCMRPAYQSLYQVARDVGAQLSFWEPEPDSWRFDPDRLESLLRPNTRLIIINFPHNPTGAFPSPEEHARIIELAARRGIYLFSDEMYRLLTHPPQAEIPAVCDRYERGISLWGMAKTFGLAGLRIGWTATHDTEVLANILRYKDYLSICNSAPSEVLATIALRHAQRFIQPNLHKILTNLRLFEDFVAARPGVFEFIPPRAGSVGFVKLRLAQPAQQFSEALLHETGIMAVPSEMFEYGQQHLRVGFGRESFPRVLEVLGQYLQG